jgi:hypothetical protein
MTVCQSEGTLRMRGGRCSGERRLGMRRRSYSCSSRVPRWFTSGGRSSGCGERVELGLAVGDGACVREACRARDEEHPSVRQIGTRPRAEQLRGVGGGEGAVASYLMTSPSSSSRASPARVAAGGESRGRGSEELPSQLATAVERAVLVRGLVSSFEISAWVTRL